MAVEEDYEALIDTLLKFRNLVSPKTPVIGCSLDNRQAAIVKESLWGRLLNLGQKEWDLNVVGSISTGLVVACNVFHYSPNPVLWLANVLRSCKLFCIQDLVLRHRGPQSLGNDGDKVRYVLGDMPIPSGFDLSPYQDRLLYYRCYDAGSFRTKQTCVNFIAVLKGQL